MQIIVNGLVAETCECFWCAEWFRLATQAIDLGVTLIADAALACVSYASPERIYIVPGCERAPLDNQTEGYHDAWVPEVKHADNVEWN